MTVAKRMRASRKIQKREGIELARNVGRKILSAKFPGKEGKIIGFEFGKRDGLLRYIVWFEDNNTEDSVIIGSKFQPDYVFVD